MGKFRCREMVKIKMLSQGQQYVDPGTPNLAKSGRAEVKPLYLMQKKKMRKWPLLGKYQFRFLIYILKLI